MNLVGQRGTTLLEILVTIVVTSIGLLGLAGMHGRMQLSEVESFQRTQALVLLQDMASRIEANRRVAASYVTASHMGVGMVCPTTNSSSTLQEVDAAQWCLALQGAAAKIGSSNVGAMLGGRGCVESLPDNQYLITVAWQGQMPVSAPPSSVSCGANAYNTPGTACVEDRCRRAITTIVRIASLN